jgi:hypothetical protein
VVAGAFQIAFRAEMHANDVFLFFKNHFWHQHIKTIQKVQTALNFSKKKKFKFEGNAGTNAVPNVPFPCCNIFLSCPWTSYELYNIFILYFSNITKH